MKLHRWNYEAPIESEMFHVKHCEKMFGSGDEVVPGR